MFGRRSARASKALRTGESQLAHKKKKGGGVRKPGAQGSHFQLPQPPGPPTHLDDESKLLVPASMQVVKPLGKQLRSKLGHHPFPKNSGRYRSMT